MVEREHGLTFGFPRMDKEAGERRDFLPPLIHRLADLGCEVFVESGIGAGMGYLDEEYVSSPRVRVVDEDAAYRQDVVVVLRAPIGKFEKIRRGATLISMLHFPTRPARVRHLEQLAVEAVGLDTIEDDEGRRLVVNSRAVAWNGLEAAFAMLERRWPQLTSPTRGPVRVTVMGAGEIGKHAVEAATKYANAKRSDLLMRYGVPGVEVVTIGRNLTCDDDYLSRRLAATDVLVDATQRHDASVPLIRNAWLGLLPLHAVICDLVVDPYLLDADPRRCEASRGSRRGTSIGTPSTSTIRRGSCCRRRSRPTTVGRWSRATRGRACTRSDAWSSTGSSSRPCSRCSSSGAGSPGSAPTARSMSARSTGGACAPDPVLCP